MTSPLNYRGKMVPSIRYGLFDNIDPALNDARMKSSWHLSCAITSYTIHNIASHGAHGSFGRMTHCMVGRKTHSVIGRKTHNPFGHLTHNAPNSTINNALGRKTSHSIIASQRGCHLIPGHHTCYPLSISVQWCYNITTKHAIGHGGFINNYFASNGRRFEFTKGFTYCNTHNDDIIMLDPSRFKYTSAWTTDIHGVHFTNTNISMANVNTFGCYVNSQAFYKLCKNGKHSALPLILAINRCIYYFMNGNFNHSHDVDHLVKRILMMLRRYIMKRNDFRYYTITLLLSGLRMSRHISLWILVVVFRRLRLAKNMCHFQQKLFTIHLSYKRITGSKLLLCFTLFSTFVGLVYQLIFPSLADIKPINRAVIGGGRPSRTDYETLKPYVITTEVQIKNPEHFNYIYEEHSTFDEAIRKIQTTEENFILCNVPLFIIADILTSTQANAIMKRHNLHALSRKPLGEKREAVKSHRCTKTCLQCFTLFKAVAKNKIKIQQLVNAKDKKEIHPKVGKRPFIKTSRVARNHKYYTRDNVKFPPRPPSKRLMHKIISDFCSNIHSNKFEEAGCAVCGQLVLTSKLTKLSNIKCSLDLLVRIGVTRLPRNSANEQIKENGGPIIDTNCKHVCNECVAFLEKKVMPPTALANGLWIGDIPKELLDLTFVERLLVARIRSNRCIVHVLRV